MKRRVRERTVGDDDEPEDIECAACRRCDRGSRHAVICLAAPARLRAAAAQRLPERKHKKSIPSRHSLALRPSASLGTSLNHASRATRRSEALPTLQRERRRPARRLWRSPSAGIFDDDSLPPDGHDVPHMTATHPGPLRRCIVHQRMPEKGDERQGGQWAAE